MLATKFSKGIVLYLAILVLAILSAMAISLSYLTMRQVFQIREIGGSVKAFFGADSGIERALFELYKKNNFGTFGETLNGVSFSATSFDPTKCKNLGIEAQYYCIRSTGTFKDISRSIEVAH